jgi:hypothetical protein
MVAGLYNQSLFSVNHFRKACNHPNLYAELGTRQSLRNGGFGSDDSFRVDSKSVEIAIINRDCAGLMALG